MVTFAGAFKMNRVNDGAIFFIRRDRIDR